MNKNLEILFCMLLAASSIYSMDNDDASSIQSDNFEKVDKSDESDNTLELEEHVNELFNELRQSQIKAYAFQEVIRGTYKDFDLISKIESKSNGQSNNQIKVLKKIYKSKNVKYTENDFDFDDALHNIAIQNDNYGLAIEQMEKILEMLDDERQETMETILKMSKYQNEGRCSIL